MEKTFYNPKKNEWFQEFPASSAVRAGDLLFISGQVSTASDGSIIAPGASRGQTAQAFESICGPLHPRFFGCLVDMFDTELCQNLNIRVVAAMKLCADIHL